MPLSGRLYKYRTRITVQVGEAREQEAKLALLVEKGQPGAVGCVVWGTSLQTLSSFLLLPPASPPSAKLWELLALTGGDRVECWSRRTGS